MNSGRSACTLLSGAVTLGALVLCFANGCNDYVDLTGARSRLRGSAEAGSQDEAGTSDVGGTDDAGGDASLGSSPSCDGLAATCGAGTASCCSSAVVPGGQFLRSYDGVTAEGLDPAFPATLSNFRLDIYETTVGRFRRFFAQYPQSLPSAGAGKHPRLPSDPGWDGAWNATMPPTRAALAAVLKSCNGYETWTDVPEANENKALNCTSWFLADAFCIWDGGWLPTEAEWNYAAVGGSEQRTYPWSVPPTAQLIDTTYYVEQIGVEVANVGSKSPKGDARWGHADVTGNVLEWTLDWLRLPYETPCVDCANMAPWSTVPTRSLRGNERPVHRNSALPDGYHGTAGMRCARSL